MKKHEMLGKKVTDKITGFSGTVVTVSQYLTGCDRLYVQPMVKEDGSYIEGNWFDVTQVEVLEGGIDPSAFTGRGDTGGPSLYPEDKR